MRSHNLKNSLYSGEYPFSLFPRPSFDQIVGWTRALHRGYGSLQKPQEKTLISYQKARKRKSPPLFFFFSPKPALRPSLPIKLHCHGGTNTKTERKPFFLSEDLGKRPVELMHAGEISQGRGLMWRETHKGPTLLTSYICMDRPKETQKRQRTDLWCKPLSNPRLAGVMHAEDEPK